MASKAFIVRSKSVVELTSLIDTRTEDVVRGLEELFTPDLEDGEPMPDFAALLRLVRRALTRRLRELEASDEEWETRRDRERRKRGKLKGLVANWRRNLNRLRNILRGIYMHLPVRERTALSDELPREPERLIAVAGHLFTWMDGLEHPGPIAPEVSTLPKIREQRQEEMKAVQAAVVEFSEIKAARVHAQSERQRVLEGFNESFVDLADLLHAVFRTAGLREEARGLRASKQEKGLTMNVMKRRRAGRAAHADGERRK